MTTERLTIEVVEFNPDDFDTYPSVCNTPEDVQSRFGYTGGEKLVFDAHGNFMGHLIDPFGGK